VQEAELQQELEQLTAALDTARLDHTSMREQLEQARAEAAQAVLEQQALEARLQAEHKAREEAEAARAYVKNVLLRAMEKGGISSLLDEALFPVIATSLQFSADETRHISEAREIATRSRSRWLG
jgi:Skp family chaperone for outer membrane proteins